MSAGFLPFETLCFTRPAIQRIFYGRNLDKLIQYAIARWDALLEVAMLQDFNPYSHERIFSGPDQDSTNYDNLDQADNVLKGAFSFQSNSGATDSNSIRQSYIVRMLPSDAELLSQLEDSDSKNGEHNSEKNFQFISSDATDSPPSGPQAIVHKPENIRGLIHGGTFINSEQAETRMQAQENLIGMGPIALPLLMLSENIPGEQIQRTRSREVMSQIVDRMNESDLLNLRDQQTRTRLIQNGLGRVPTDAEAEILKTTISNTVNEAMASRLQMPNWLDGAINVGPDASEQTIEQIDRLGTNEGRLNVARRINQLSRMITSEHTTAHERMQISFQLRELSIGTSPYALNSLAMRGREALSNQLRRSSVRDQPRIDELDRQYRVLRDTGNPKLHSSDTMQNALRDQLQPPEWERLLTQGKGSAIFYTDESLRQMDRLSTPEGQREVAQRLDQLSRLLTTDGVTRWGRQDIADEMSTLSIAVSPWRSAERRIIMRTSMAELLIGTNRPADSDRLVTLMLDAHRIATQTGGRINDVLEPMIDMNLDQNPAFMDRFRSQASPQTLESLHDLRQRKPVRSTHSSRSGK